MSELETKQSCPKPSLFTTLRFNMDFTSSLETFSLSLFLPSFKHEYRSERRLRNTGSIRPSERCWRLRQEPGKTRFPRPGSWPRAGRPESWTDLLQQKQGPIPASPKASFWNEVRYKSLDKAKERLIGEEDLWSRAKKYSWDWNTRCKMEGGALQARGGENESPKMIQEW